MGPSLTGLSQKNDAFMNMSEICVLTFVIIILEIKKQVVKIIKGLLFE